MAWYDADWSTRLPVLGSDATGTEDTRITIRAGSQTFWGAVDSAGDDIRVTDATGINLVDYELTTWSYATRSAVIDLDAANTNYSVFWFYVGNASATATATTLADTIGGAGELDDLDPTANSQARIVVVSPLPPGSTSLRDVFTKTSSERAMIWWDITDMLARYEEEYEGALFNEEPSTLSYQVTTGGTPQAAMDGEPTIIATQSGRGRILIGTPVQAGSDGTDYTVELTVNTVLAGGDFSTTFNTIEARCKVEVIDPDETT